MLVKLTYNKSYNGQNLDPRQSWGIIFLTIDKTQTLGKVEDTIGVILLLYKISKVGKVEL